MNNALETNELRTKTTTHTPLQNTETAAVAYAAAGLSVLPLELPLKNPAYHLRWSVFQKEIASAEQIKSWFKDSSVQIGIVCGKVSGNLEALDFDEKYNVEPKEIFPRFKDLVEAQSPGLMDKLVTEKSISGGYHLLYRCENIEPSKKLAMRTPTASEIETAVAE